MLLPYTSRTLLPSLLSSTSKYASNALTRLSLNYSRCYVSSSPSPQNDEVPKFNESTEKQYTTHSEATESVTHNNASTRSSPATATALEYCTEQAGCFQGAKSEYHMTFKRWRHSFFAKHLLKQFCPSIFQSGYFQNECRRGAAQAIQHFYNCLMKEDHQALTECIDEHLLENILLIFSKIKASGYHLELEINKVISSSLFDINLIFGAQRKVTVLRNLKQLHLFGGHHLITPASNGLVAPPILAYSGSAVGPVMLPLPSSEEKLEKNVKEQIAVEGGDQSNSNAGFRLSFSAPEAVNQAMHEGGAVRIDILCDVKQKLVITEVDNPSQIHTFPTLAKHHLRFEMDLDPDKNYAAGLSPPRYDGSEWKLIDFNGVMRGNYPVDISKLSNVVVKDSSNQI